MGYADIDNLYKNGDVLLFKEVYALEKIHGSSSHVSWKDGALNLFSGGAKHAAFEALFDLDALGVKFLALGHPCVVVYGEVYGGQMQGMKDTYGPSLRFVVFDVKIVDAWLSVPQAEDVAAKLGLEFVPYVKCPATLEELNSWRDADSVQAKHNGILEPRKREGIVIRPLIELTKNDGSRIMAKHKRDEFMETKTPREVDPAKRKVLTEAQEIADEWVTPMRIRHVLDHLGISNPVMEATGDVIRETIADIRREGAGEIEWSREAETAIGRATACLLRKHVMRTQLLPGADHA